MAGYIGKDHVGRSGNDHRADGQTIQTIGQVDGVGSPHDHHSRKYNIAPAKIR